MAQRLGPTDNYCKKKGTLRKPGRLPQRTDVQATNRRHNKLRKSRLRAAIIWMWCHHYRQSVDYRIVKVLPEWLTWATEHVGRNGVGRSPTGLSREQMQYLEHLGKPTHP